MSSSSSSYPSAPPRPLLDMHLHDHYSPYSTPDSPSPDEDENASLRSQALNADGTPKRPMNAFMIFARRRRPQVSAANQMMRTGEISKILSKEWNTMPISDKQFYLDQAKKLKENFNAKYPDYVYRRRPNNSRKKRRTDLSARGVDAYADPRDDSLSPHEHSPEYHPHPTHSASLSPVDALVPNDHSAALAAHQYRLPYSAYHADAAASSAYPYYSPSHHRTHAAQGHVHPHAHAHAQGHYDPLASVSYPPAAHAHAHAGIYQDDDALTGWPAASLAAATAVSAPFPRLESIKPEHPWSSALSARRGTLQPAPLPLRSGHGRHWSSSSSTGSPASAPASATAPSFPQGFQTLTAPFYPSSGTVSPSTASSSSVASYFGGAGAQTGSSGGAAAASAAEREFETQARTQDAQGQSPPFQQSQAQQQQQQHRAYSGATLGSTLALSPASSLWSSVRSSTALAKPEL